MPSPSSASRTSWLPSTPALQVVTDVSAADAALPTAGLRGNATAAATRPPPPRTRSTELASAGRRATAPPRSRSAPPYDVLDAEAGDWQHPRRRHDAHRQRPARGRYGHRRGCPGRRLGCARRLTPPCRMRTSARTSAPASRRSRALSRWPRCGRSAEAIQAQAEAVGGALASLGTLVPDWQIPAVVTTPIEARDFTTAAEVASAAQRWIVNACRGGQEAGRHGASERVRAAVRERREPGRPARQALTSRRAGTSRPPTSSRPSSSGRGTARPARTAGHAGHGRAAEPGCRHRCGRRRRGRRAP